MIRIRLNPRIYAYLQEEMPEILEETGAVEKQEVSVKETGAVEKTEGSAIETGTVEKTEGSAKETGAVHITEEKRTAVEKAGEESCEKDEFPSQSNGSEETENTNINQSEIKTCTILIDESQKDLEMLLNRLSYLDSDD